MNSRNRIRSVELLYYCYWCTYIACTLPVNALLLHYRNLLSCLLCFSIFLVYISCFALFSFGLISAPLFFKRRLFEFIIFSYAKEPLCLQLHPIAYHSISLLCKKPIRLFHGTIFNCILYVQSFFFITSHWIFKWWECF